MPHEIFNDRNIITLFKKVGLSRTEVKCYLASLALGPAMVSEIANTVRINRANAYGALKRLAEYGLIEREITPKGARIHTTPFEQLQTFAQAYQKRAIKLRWRIEDIIPKLSALVKNHVEKPQVLVYEGVKAIHAMINRTLTVPVGSEILQVCLFSGRDDIVTPEYSKENYIPQRIKRDCLMRLLCPKTPLYQSVAKNDHADIRRTRFLPREYTSEDNLTSIHIYGNEIALYWRAPDPRGMTIKSNKIASTMRILFNIAWDIAEKPK